MNNEGDIMEMILDNNNIYNSQYYENNMQYVDILQTRNTDKIHDKDLSFDTITLALDVTYESKDSNTVEVNQEANLTTSGREYASTSKIELTPINTIATNQSGKYTEDMSALFGSSFSSHTKLTPAKQTTDT